MRVGSIAFATSRGLGHLAHDFYCHGIVTDVMVVRHPSVPTNEDWYPGAPETPLRPFDANLARDFCRGKDAMLFFELPFDWNLLPYCREIGVPTFLIPMYECWPKSAPRPYKYIFPSLLDMDYFKDGVFLPLPVEYPWRERTHALHYIHNGGYLGIRGREGTCVLIEAMRHVRSPLRLTIRVQENVDSEHQRMAAADPRIEYIAATVPYDELYATGDVSVGAQKWNGCSLPLQEARASGMLVMNTDRFPANTWLPREPLIPVASYKTASIGPAYLEFEEAVVTPSAIASTIDRWYGAYIADYSRGGKEWAERHSWAALGPRFREALTS